MEGLGSPEGEGPKAEGENVIKREKNIPVRMTVFVAESVLVKSCFFGK